MIRDITLDTKNLVAHSSIVENERKIAICDLLAENDFKPLNENQEYILEDDILTVKEIIHSTGAITYCKEKTRQLCGKAVNELDKATGCKAIEQLRSVAEMMVQD